MKLNLATSLSILFAANAAAAPLEIEERASSVQGFDISHYQPNVDFKAAYKDGARFVIIKATEGTTYRDPSFSSHYAGATAAGLIRGGYHFAQPSSSSGTTQANYFLAHGGGWSADGRTLPGMLDIEYGPGGNTCYGLSHAATVAWIHAFVTAYHGKTKRYPSIYSTADWWSTCTGNTKDFHTTCPLVLANYNAHISTVPGGWPFQTIWQYNDHYKYGGDSDRFNGDLAGLKKLAKG